MRTRIYKLSMIFLMCVLLLSMSNSAVCAAGKTLKVSGAKSTIYVLDNQNNTSQLKVMYGNKDVTRACKYSVNNRKVASVSKSGKITAVKAGKVTVTVKYKKNSKKFKITVKNPKLIINGKNLQLSIGQTYALKVYANQSVISKKDITWSSSNKRIATVSKSGVVKGIKAGTSVITGKTKTGKVSCKVIIKKTTNNSNNSNVSNSNNTTDAGGCKHDGATEQIDRPGKFLMGYTCGCGLNFTRENNSLDIHQAEQLFNSTLPDGTLPDDYECASWGGPTRLIALEPEYMEEMCMKCGKSLGVTQVFDMHVHNWLVTADIPKDFEYTVDNTTTYHVQHYKEKQCTTCGMRIGEYQYYTTTE